MAPLRQISQFLNDFSSWETVGPYILTYYGRCMNIFYQWWDDGDFLYHIWSSIPRVHYCHWFLIDWITASEGNKNNSDQIILMGFQSVVCTFAVLVLSLSLPRSHQLFSLLSNIQFSWKQFREFSIWSTNIPSIDLFLYCRHLCAW